MLKKLLKYELKSIYKFLIIFYSLAFFFGLLTRIFLSIDNSFICNLIGQICSGASISMMFNIVINNLMRLWGRFRKNLYGDESYLTHTLPIDKKTLYLSKMITSIFSLLTSILVIGLTIFIAYYSVESVELVKKMLLPVTDILNSTMLKILIAFLLVFFLEFACVLQTGYTGIILGHKMNNTKIGFSVLFGFLAYIVTQLFVLFIMFMMALFNPNIMNLFYTNQAIDIETVKIIIYMAIVIYLVILLISYFINVKLFTKGVNVD